MAILAHATSLAEMVKGEINASHFAVDTNAARMAPNVSESIRVYHFNTVGGAVLDFPDASDFWISFYVYELSVGARTALLTILSDGVPLFQLDPDAISSGTLSFEYWDGSAWIESHADVAGYISGQRFRFDVHVAMADVGGIMEWYVDGALKGSYTGDTLRTAATTCNELRLDNTYNTGGTNFSYFSAVIVADEDTRNMVYVQNTLTGAGTHNEQTGGYADVDETGVNTADFLQASAVGQRETFTVSALPAGFNTGYDVLGVGVAAYAQNGAGGPSNLKTMVRSGTVDAESAASALDNSPLPVSGFFDVNPDTGVAWTIANTNSREVGVRSA